MDYNYHKRQPDSIIDFSELSRAAREHHPLAWPYISGACNRLSNIFRETNVSNEMWDLTVATVSFTKTSNLVFLKKILGHLLNCWTNSRNDLVVDFLTRCFESKKINQYFKIVRQLDFLLKANLNKSVIDLTMKTAIQMSSKPEKAYAFLATLESELKKAQFTDDLIFRIKATSLIFSGSWNYKLTSDALEEFLILNKSSREKELVLKELQFCKGRFNRKPILPVMLLNTDSEQLLKLLEISLTPRQDSKAIYYSESIEESENLNSLLPRLPESVQDYILNRLEVFKGNQKELLQAFQHYSVLALNWHNNQRAEHYFDSIIEKDENYIFSGHALSRRPFLADQPPWVQGSQNEKLARNQAILIAAGAKDFSRGFGQFTIAARHLPDGRMPALERFGRDIFSCVSKVNAQDINLFPGRGWLFSMPQTERFLAKNDLDELLEENPFKAWKQDWPFLENEIDIFHKSEILITRGLIVFNNLDQRFNYFGSQYCYVIFNDHYHRFEHQAGYLMPWRVIQETINPCLSGKISAQNYLPEISDINKQELCLEYMIRRCNQLDLPILNLSWPSNLGGLCNAFPGASRFYHDFEIELENDWLDWWDMWGHLHKALIDNEWHPNGIPAWKEQLYIPLQKAHNEVYEISLSYQNLAHLFKIAFSFWQKGFCDPLRGEIGQPVLFSKPSYAEIKERDDFLKSYLLREAYRWHKSASEKGLKADKFPVLGINNVFQCSSAPQSGFSLDTYSMHLRWSANGKQQRYSLNKTGLDREDQQIWLEHICPIFEDITVAPNFFHRQAFEDLE